MSSGNLLEIYYDRVIDTKKIELTKENCDEYDYYFSEKEIDGVSYTIFYKKDDKEENYIKDENGLPSNKIEIEITKKYSHIAPPCSKYQYSFADVDKDGSGRNSSTGEMFRERIGNYFMLEVAWDLIPNSVEFNNWYKVLTHLPPYFHIKSLSPNGNIEEKKVYRGDISTDLYLFIKDRQIWQGLSTTFTQWDIDKYSDNEEPILNEVENLT